jgi:Ni/Co efflux regulator RcnB
MANTNQLLLCGYSSLVTRRNGPASPKETAMTTRSTLTKFTLLAATLAAGIALTTAGGAQARDDDRHDHDGYSDRDRDHDRDRDRNYDRDRDDHDHPPYHANPIVYHPVHGPGSSHNPITVVVRDHRDSGFPGNVNDHRGSGAPGGVTVSGGGTAVVSQPTCHFYVYYNCGSGYYGQGGHGRGGQSGGGFQGDVRDHRG